MDDDVGGELRRRQELRLIKTFLGIRDAGRRQRILKLAEQLADDAAADAAGLGFVSTDAALVEASRDVPGRTE